MKLNQVIALLQGKKARATKMLTEIYQKMGLPVLQGISRTYQPVDEDGEKFPSEHKEVVLSIKEVIDKLKKTLGEFYDILATQEYANQQANANIKIDGNVLLEAVPVTILLFLEKQIVDLLTLAKSLPVLPTEKSWTFDAGKNCYVAPPEQTTKTQKLPKVIVKYEATKEHPAQTELFSVDMTIGHWTTVHMSGAMPVKERDEIVERLEKLQDAVKTAREEANSLEAGQPAECGNVLLDYIFGK